MFPRAPMSSFEAIAEFKAAKAFALPERCSEPPARARELKVGGLLRRSLTLNWKIIFDFKVKFYFLAVVIVFVCFCFLQPKQFVIVTTFEFEHVNTSFCAFFDLDELAFA